MTALSIPLPAWLARPVARRSLIAGTAIAVIVLYVLFRDQFALEHDDGAPVFRSLTDLRTTIDSSRSSNPVLVALVDVIRMPIGSFVELFATALTTLPWLGITVTVAMIGLVVGGIRMALLAGLGFLSFGLLGLWEESMDTLALTLAAVVLSLLVGVPLGIWAGRSDRFMALIRPILDTLQIMPTIAYLAPLTLFFLIGPATAVIATMIYAVPTTIRITALGIRGVAPTSLEAAASLGATRWQSLRKVQLPMARRTLILGINQTMMMALAMVVITALINAPGLGQSVVRALQRVDVGKAFEAGLAIVIMAVVLDRLTTAAGERSEARFRAGRVETAAHRRNILGVAIVASVVAMAVGLLVPIAGTWPDDASIALAGPVNDLSDAIKLHGYQVTTAIKDVVTYGLINPLQSLLTSAPWWLVIVAVVAFTLLMGTARAAATAGVALLVIVLLGLWEHGMITLATTLVATAIVLGVGLVGGILFARRERLATALRPVLDAAQTMPSFVYLVPALALFGATRFTAIVAAFIYATPSVIRLVEDGIRGVPHSVTEAAVSTGATPRQLLWKVQLPVARSSLLLAANQGVVLVLAMVVVGGLVGAGALGFDVVEGFSQRTDFGRGLAAGVAIVLLGIMLDRVSQGAASRRPKPTLSDEG
jgi:glycine betaine/proline transport system permease protein